MQMQRYRKMGYYQYGGWCNNIIIEYDEKRQGLPDVPLHMEQDNNRTIEQYNNTTEEYPYP